MTNALQLSATILSIVAISAFAAPPANAASKSPAHEQEPNFEFDIMCNREFVVGSVAGLGYSLTDNGRPPWFMPRCMMIGDTDGATYLCKCEDEEHAIIGDSQMQELFPDGVPDPDESEDVADELFQTLKGECERVFYSHCGPFPENIDRSCGNAFGVCEVLARGDGEVGNYSQITARCECESGAAWLSGAQSLQDRPYDEEQAQTLCEAELHGCGPSVNPGPTNIDLFPELDPRRRWAGCERPLAGEASLVCRIWTDGVDAGYSCYRDDREAVDEVEGSLESKPWPSRVELHSECVQILERVGSDSPEEPQDPQEPQPDSPSEEDRHFGFDVQCGHSGSSVGIRKGWQSAANSQPTPWVSAQCMMMGNPDTATYVCRCEETDGSIVGQLKTEDMFPDGVISPSSEAAQHELVLALTSACERVFDKYCGPFPEDIDYTCGNPDGQCNVLASGERQVGHYSQISSQCTCENGAKWTSGTQAAKDRAFDDEQARGLCEEELRACAPPVDPGPSDVELFPDSEPVERWAHCERPRLDGEASECHLSGFDGFLEFYCYCSESQDSVRGGRPSEQWPTRTEMFDECEELIEIQCPIPPEEPQEPEPDEPEDVENPDIDDVLEKLGCRLGGSEPLTPWLLPGWALALVALRRRD